MKLKIFLSLFFTAFIHFSFSQPYQSIFGENETSWSILLDFSHEAVSSNFHIIGSDTIINEKNYKKISEYYSEYNRYISEDTINGKLWYYNPNNMEEYLIMDLGLSIGDTLYFDNLWLCYSIGLQDCGFIEYAVVDTVFYLDERKIIVFDLCLPLPILTLFTIFVHCETKLTFIEGIGPNAGIIYQEIDNVNNVSSTLLLCAFKDGIKIYEDPTLKTCFVSIHINNINSYDNYFKIFPNPATSVFNVTAEENNPHNIKIYSLLGQKVLDSDFFGQESFNIDFLPSGLYLIEISDFLSKKHFYKLIKN